MSTDPELIADTSGDHTVDVHVVSDEEGTPVRAYSRSTAALGAATQLAGDADEVPLVGDAANLQPPVDAEDVDPDRLNLSPSASAALLALAAWGPSKTDDLADRALMNRRSMTSGLQELKAAGLATYRDDFSDSRFTVWSIDRSDEGTGGGGR